MQDQITKDTAHKLETMSNIMWQAMEVMIKNFGHTSGSLLLEGSVYDLREIVEKAKIAK